MRFIENNNNNKLLKVLLNIKFLFNKIFYYFYYLKINIIFIKHNLKKFIKMIIIYLKQNIIFFSLIYYSI